MLLKFKQMVKFTDMFYSSQMLRHQDQQEYRTITGGLISLAIITTTIIGFASMILETLDRSTITTTMEMVKNVDPTLSSFISSPQHHFMFAVEIWRLDVTGPQRYFDVTLSQEIGLGEVINTTFFPLQPCTREHWTLIPSLESNFEKLNIGNWLCPPIGLNFTINGKYTSDIYSSYALTVSACKNQTDPSRPCASQQKIDEIFTSFQQQFWYTLYITNPTINPSSKHYKSYYLQDENYVIFGSRVGSLAYVFFSDYTISSDYSIWPFKDIEIDQGLIIQNIAANHPIQTVQDGIYAQIYLAKSPNSIKYTRQVQKITSVFSFIGGMISAASALLFFIKIYTNLSYEISIAISLFNPHKSSKVQSEKLCINFITFIKYHLYSLSQIVGIKLNWPNIQYLSQCQSQIVKQLDINKIVKRFVFIEHCLTYLFDDFQLNGLQLKSPSSLEQIRSVRQKCTHVDDKDQNYSSNADEKMSNLKDYELQGSLPLQSNIQLLKPQGKKYYEHNIVIQDISNQSGSKKSCELKIIPTKKRSIKQANVIDNNFAEIQARQKYLAMLKMHAQSGNQLSRKIWQSLSKEIQQKAMSEEFDKNIGRFQRQKMVFKAT